MKYSLEMIKYLLNNATKGTYASLAVKFNKKFKTNQSANALRKTIEHYANIDIKAEEDPKILILDIETSYMLARVWGPKVDYINHSDILQDFKVLTVSYKFHGKENKPVTLAASIKNGKIDDKDLLKKLAKVLNEADYVAGHNSARFDIPKLSARTIHNNLPPLSVKKQIDTMRIARKHFGFTSNRLDYLSKFLGVDPGGKLKHDGIELWAKVMSGDKKALKHMMAYNEKDILLTEKVLDKLLPYSDIKLIHTKEEKCPQCRSLKVNMIGSKQMASGTHNHYSCGNCTHKFFLKAKKK